MAWGNARVIKCYNGVGFVGNAMKELFKMVGILMKYYILYHTVSRAGGTDERHCEERAEADGPGAQRCMGCSSSVSMCTPEVLTVQINRVCTI